jgi:hypothetical protein
MQEESPEEFKEFSLTAKKLEDIAKEKPVLIQDGEEKKEGEAAQPIQSYAESFAKFLSVL